MADFKQCPKCRSHDVRACATVRWSNAARDWIICSVAEDDLFCNDCGFDSHGDTVSHITIEAMKHETDNT